jgi:hypothetical protein
MLIDIFHVQVSWAYETMLSFWDFVKGMSYSEYANLRGGTKTWIKRKISNLLMMKPSMSLSNYDAIYTHNIWK